MLGALGRCVSASDLLVLSGALLLRSLLSSHPHSGLGQPPMHGDYEAQRHWQEVTLHLPVHQWYDAEAYNMTYWGLDYPPLTAYHSLALAYAAKYGLKRPDFVAWETSRGVESDEHRLFMRWTVMAADVVVYLPALVFLARTMHPYHPGRSTLSLALLCLYPGQMLIDNGHFQYNNVSLGLFALAVALLLRRRDLLASVFFVLALNYKQMELYHALPFFFYLLSSCCYPDADANVREASSSSALKRGLAKLAGLGVAVVGTCIVVWGPFLRDWDTFRQVVHRIFPFARGLFEDKVANFWCSLNVLYKLKNLYDIPTLASMCMVTTFVLALPCNLHLFMRPTRRNFLLALVNTSLAFFLFSFQVHEKSILVVSLPVCMFAVQTDRGRYSSLACVWFLLVSTFSMTPLLLKDGLLVPAVALSAFYLVGSHYAGLLDPINPLAASDPSAASARHRVRPIQLPTTLDMFVWTGFALSVVGCLALAAASVLVRPPIHLPDLWAVLVSAYAAAHFLAFFAYGHYLQFCGGYQTGGSLAGAGAGGGRKRKIN